MPQLIGELKDRGEPDGSFLPVVFLDFQRDRVVFVVPGHVHPHVAVRTEHLELLGTMEPEGKGALRADLAGELELRQDGLGHPGPLAVVAARVDPFRFAARDEPGVVYTVAAQVVRGAAALVPVEPPVEIRSQVTGIHRGRKGAADQFDLADLAGVDELLRPDMARVVAELEGLGEQDAVVPGGLDHGFALGRRRTDGLFAQDRPDPAGPRGPDAEIRVGIAPGTDGEDVDFFFPQHALQVRVAAGDPEGLAESLQCVLGDVADRGQFRFRGFLRRFSVAVRDSACANDAHPVGHDRAPSESKMYISFTIHW